MENVRKHITEELERADSTYWDVYHRLEQKKMDLSEAQHDVIWLEKDLEKYENEKKYFMKLLNELDENGNNAENK